MDQELIAYLDERFRETWKQIEGLREETSRRFEQVDSRFEQVDSRFEQVDSRFEQVDSRFEQAGSRFERVESEIRQTQVMVEGVRGEVRLLAEGVMGVNEKLQLFRAEVKQEFDDTRGLIRSSYAEVERRVHSLEDWRELKERDPLDLIYEKFGKTPRKTPG